MAWHGFRFNPTDEEVLQILDHKASGQEMALHNYFIVEANIYDYEPQDLPWHQAAGIISNGERYYYCKRETDSREVAGRGWWKATSHLKKIYEGHQLVGYKRPLTFHKYKLDCSPRSTRNNAVKKTNWIMHEYSLQARSTEWRICKIKYKGNQSLQEEANQPISRSNRVHQKESGAGSSSCIHIGDGGQSDFVSVQPSTTIMPLDNGCQPAPPFQCNPFDQSQYTFDANATSYCNYNNLYNDWEDELYAEFASDISFPSPWPWQN